MGVEAYCYRIIQKKQKELAHSELIEKGKVGEIDFIEPAKILAVCDTDDVKGTIWFKNSQGVVAMLSEDDEDSKGKKLNLEEPISFSGLQFVSILARDRRRGIVIFHSRKDDEGMDYNPPRMDDIVAV
ncbi:MAG: hypothetical protein AAB675_00565 [Patescibacteria group bacterium]